MDALVLGDCLLLKAEQPGATVQDRDRDLAQFPPD
jgi:hypothetical protein